jgi:hypothetical protein
VSDQRWVSETDLRFLARNLEILGAAEFRAEFGDGSVFLRKPQHLDMILSDEEEGGDAMSLGTVTGYVPNLVREIRRLWEEAGD